MLEIRERAQTVTPPPLTLTLPFELRQRSRQRVTLSSGDEAALLLARGILHPVDGGEVLVALDLIDFLCCGGVGAGDGGFILSGFGCEEGLASEV